MGLALFLNVPDALLEERDNMRVNHTIEDFFAIAARPNDMHLTQSAHVVRDGGLTDTDQFCQY